MCRAKTVWDRVVCPRGRVPISVNSAAGPAPVAERIGAAELEGIEEHLTALVGAQPVRFDTPGWIARDIGEPA